MKNRDEGAETYNFYDSILLDDFLEAAKRAGLKDNPDMKKIAPFLKNAKKILDMGAGYGRCLEFLVNNFSGEIHAVEFSDNLVELLKRRFLPRVYIYKQDMRKLNVGNGFDIVLSNWGSVNNLDYSEQLQLLKDLRLITTKSGIIFFETKRKQFQDEEKPEKKQSSRFTHANTNKFFLGYITSEEEFKEMAKVCDYKLRITEYDIPLEQDKIAKRVLYMFEKCHQ